MQEPSQRRSALLQAVLQSERAGLGRGLELSGVPVGGSRDAARRAAGAVPSQPPAIATTTTHSPAFTARRWPDLAAVCPFLAPLLGSGRVPLGRAGALLASNCRTAAPRRAPSTAAPAAPAAPSRTPWIDPSASSGQGPVSFGALLRSSREAAARGVGALETRPCGAPSAGRPASNGSSTRASAASPWTCRQHRTRCLCWATEQHRVRAGGERKQRNGRGRAQLMRLHHIDHSLMQLHHIDHSLMRLHHIDQWVQKLSALYFLRT